MYSQATVSSACGAARAVLRWDGTPEKGGPGQPGHAGTFGVGRLQRGADTLRIKTGPVAHAPGIMRRLEWTFRT